MSEALLRVRFRFDEATYLKGAKIAYDVMMKHTGRKYVGWFFIALAQFGVVGALRAGTYGLLLLSTLLLLYWYVLRWPLRKAALKRVFHRSPYADRDLTLEAQEGGLCVDDKCIPWFEFTRVLATPQGYLLDMSDAFLFIPRDAFEDDKTRTAFVALMRAHVKRFEKIDD
ncbi:MAG: hypothetical protein GXO33_06685 [Epsilonproteobacteria bacterium]|nr:hypothetical protein [Campylobacterota bacterium]